MTYNSWPLGKLQKRYERPELDSLRLRGYEFYDPREVIEIFEQKLADYCGSKFAVVVDSCTNALFLCMKYKQVHGSILLPRHTYCSVPMQVIHAGCRISWVNLVWKGSYSLRPYGIWDCAARFTKGMFESYINSTILYCLSFQIKKRLPIGKGGAILTNSETAYNWFKTHLHDGRDLNNPYDEDEFNIGYHFNMTPEDAARGILLFDDLTKEQQDFEDLYGWDHFTDLSEQECFKPYTA